MVINLSNEHSLVSNWVSELRDIEVQKDRMRFRRNLERIAEVIGYEISKRMAWEEKKNPTRFLSVEGEDRKNLLRQTVVRGTISNKATVASFKDIDVELSFYSETGALLLKDHEVVYKVVGPNSSESFKYKTYAPKGTDSLAMKISGAKTE